MAVEPPIAEWNHDVNSKFLYNRMLAVVHHIQKSKSAMHAMLSRLEVIFLTNHFYSMLLMIVLY